MTFDLASGDLAGVFGDEQPPSRARAFQQLASQTRLTKDWMRAARFIGAPLVNDCDST